jgi:hypothetical protein
MGRHSPVKKVTNPMLCSFKAAVRIQAIRHNNPEHNVTTACRRELGTIWETVIKLRHLPPSIWDGHNYDNTVEDFAPATGDGK